MPQSDDRPDRDREQWAVRPDEHRTDFARAESPLKYQVGAWALWALGFAAALVGIACATGGLDVPVLADLPALSVALAVAVDLAAVLTAQRLWKKAGSLAHGGRQGVLGVAMACLAFAPMCLFFLAARNAAGSTRAAATAAALVSVGVIAGLSVVLRSV